MDFDTTIRQALQTGGERAAVALAEDRARAGDPQALTMVGYWRIWGIHGNRDHAAAYAAFAQAAGGGDGQAALVQAALLTTGTGTPRDPEQAIRLTQDAVAISPLAARQRQLLAAMSSVVAPPLALRADPMVSRIDGLLTPDECAYLIDRATPIIGPSLVVDPRTRQRIPNPVRDSFGGNFAPPDEDVVIHAINCRIAAATGTTWEQGEPLHILRYAPGQQYRPHLDALPGAANQRVLTMLIYLNEGYEGGETGFTQGLVFKGGTGDAVIFTNTDALGRPDARTQQAGLPVIHGTKWLATRWIRARSFDPWSG